MQKITVKSRGDIASALKEARERKGWTKNKLRMELSYLRGKQVGACMVDSLEGGNDSPSYQVDLLLDAARLLNVEIVIQAE